MIVKRIFTGLGFMLEGFRLLKAVPGLFIWAFIPFLIDLTLLIVFVGWGFSSMSVWVASTLGFFLSPSIGFIYQLVYYPLYLLLAFGFTVITLYAVFLISTVIASPFNAVMAEKTLAYLGILPAYKFSFGRWALVSIKMMLAALLRSLVFAVLGVFIFIFSYVPGLNLLASFAAFMVISFDSMDYTYEAMEMSLRERLKHFRLAFNEYCGMSGAIGLTLLLPGLTLLLLPLNVIGAASINSKTRAAI